MHQRLESDYRAPLGVLPSGVREGRHLGFLDGPIARRPDVRLVHSALFVLPRWGIDLERQLWWFVRPTFAIGRFRIERARSRWRDAEVLQLHYDVSRLPVRGLLYDELKPLPDGRVIGIGGTNHGAGFGDHFWFELW